MADFREDIDIKGGLLTIDDGANPYTFPAALGSGDDGKFFKFDFGTQSVVVDTAGGGSDTSLATDDQTLTAARTIINAGFDLDISGSGKFGVGTSPNSKFHVRSDSGAFIAQFDEGGSPKFVIGEFGDIGVNTSTFELTGGNTTSTFRARNNNLSSGIAKFVLNAGTTALHVIGAGIGVGIDATKFTALKVKQAGVGGLGYKSLQLLDDSSNIQMAFRTEKMGIGVVSAAMNTGDYNDSSFLNLDAPSATYDFPSLLLRSSGGYDPTTALTDGAIWFDGTDLKMRVGGVTKTFTLT